MEASEKLSITVPSDLARLIRDKVRDGSFASEGKVVEAGLRALEREEEDHAERLAAIKARIQASIADPRPSIPMEKVFRELKDRLEHLAEEHDDAPVAGSVRT